MKWSNFASNNILNTIKCVKYVVIIHRFWYSSEKMLILVVVSVDLVKSYPWTWTCFWDSFFNHRIYSKTIKTIFILMLIVLLQLWTNFYQILFQWYNYLRDRGGIDLLGNITLDNDKNISSFTFSMNASTCWIDPKNIPHTFIKHPLKYLILIFQIEKKCSYVPTFCISHF